MYTGVDWLGGGCVVGGGGWDGGRGALMWVCTLTRFFVFLCAPARANR